jgi:general secretion pathway protein A
MYLDFYGFSDRPFGSTPDPKFLHLTSGHREALAQLVYGVQERKGFILLVGEVGTGKTTLLRSLISRLDRDTAAAYVANSALSADEILEYLLADLGVQQDGPSRAQRLMALNRFLIDQHRAGSNTVLVLDEAQNLDIGTLEGIRLLSNFETHSDKLLQIVLAGQPELEATLQRPDLRQLRQRIALRCRIPPMSPEETREYVAERMRIAGARTPALFTGEAIELVTRYARGIPRLVNILCDHCLVMGYANQVRRIDARIVRRAIEYLEEGEPGPVRARLRRRAMRAALATLAACAVVVAAVVLVLQSNHGGPLSGGVLEPLSALARWWGR